MVISRDIAALSKKISAQPGISSEFSSSVEPSDSFQNVLKSLLSKAQGATASSNLPPSINQEQLNLLLHALQIQMNSRRYNSLLNNGLELNYLAEKIISTYSAQMTKFGSEASNNRQISPKTVNFSGDSNIEKIIQEAADQYGMDANLIRSVVKAESNFKPEALSSKGAMGLMQLMPDTAKELGVKDAYDARENIMGGTRYLKTLLDRYNGKVDLALAAYNWGMGNLEKRPHNLPQETLNYISKVNSYYKVTPQA